MKVTKHIMKLAKEINYKENGNSDKDKYDYDWSAHNAEHMMNIKEALLKGRLYLRVDSVSKSGMSRVIEIKFIKNNELHGVCDWVYTELVGTDKNNRIQGCGMDMLFETQYRLWRALLPKKPYQKMPHYKNL